MTYETIKKSLDGPIARITLNRPEVRNAMNRQMVADLLDCFESIRDNRDVRVVVVGAAGEAFCAGGDVGELRRARAASDEENLDFARTFEEMLLAVRAAPQVVIVRVQGAAMGGGFGLVCVSDVAVASETARMGMPEARLGLAPALISPYVVERVGLSRARQLVLTGETFNGLAARAYGVVHEAPPPDELDERVDHYVRLVLQCAPAALAEIKRLLFEVAGRPPAETLQYRADLLTRLRRSEEGQEGMRAFLEKRPPGWAKSTRR
ncbi:MAG: enoyl-CoA hydratase-related protein [Anaerolineae bacterium]